MTIQYTSTHGHVRGLPMPWRTKSHGFTVDYIYIYIYIDWLQNRVRAVKNHHLQNSNLYRTRNSRHARRLWCIYSLPCILVNWLNVCFDFWTRKKTQICIAYFYVIFIWSLNMFLSYFKLNFCQQVACMRFNRVSGKLLAKREICHCDKDCHVKSLIITNLYFVSVLINRYA